MSVAEIPQGIVRIGVDIGGTFTDVTAVGADGNLHIGKRLTTHGAEHEGVIQAVMDTGVHLDTENIILAHGTTLVINALLERKGARIALVTTKGFSDVLEIGRGARSEIFTMRFQRSAPLVARDMRFELDERIAADGSVLRAPSDSELESLAQAVRAADAEAVAIAFLNSYIEPAHEKRVAEYLRHALDGIPVTISSDISRQWREYERFTTATANAYAAPVANRYLSRLHSGLSEKGFGGQFVVLDSSGGAMEKEVAARFPVRAVESGPVGGVIAARALAASLQIDNLVSLDMGGTTAKSAVIEGGDYATKDLYWIGGEHRGFPLQVSTVDIIEVGVGGGSIAWLDSTGTLQVGPHSAGSKPGPVCYGLGGTEPTLTDANLYCGRIDKDHFAGSFSLDYDGARIAIEKLAARAGMTPERLALGIIRLGVMRSSSTIRRQTLERGNDPNIYTLLASGGAGPLHICEIAAEVGIDRVLIPRLPGHYSAFGMLGANLRVDRREVLTGPLETLSVDRVREIVRGIGEHLAAELNLSAGEDLGNIRFTCSISVRYKGQEHAVHVSGFADGLTIPDDLPEQLKAAYEAEYLRRYGHLDALSPLETSELQLVAERALPPVQVDFKEGAHAHEAVEHVSLWEGQSGPVKTLVMPRTALAVGQTLTGPLVIHEVGSTTAIPPGAVVEVQSSGALLVSVANVGKSS